MAESSNCVITEQLKIRTCLKPILHKTDFENILQNTELIVFVIIKNENIMSYN